MKKYKVVKEFCFLDHKALLKFLVGTDLVYDIEKNCYVGKDTVYGGALLPTFLVEKYSEYFQEIKEEVKKYKLMYNIYGTNGNIREQMYSVQTENYWRNLYGNMLDVLPAYFEEVKEKAPFNPKEQHYDAEFVNKFIDDNYSWLEKWFENPVDYLKTPDRPEHLVDRIKGFQKNRACYLRYDQSDIEWAKYQQDKFIEHKKEILTCAVFSKYSKLAYRDGLGDPLYNMGGFIEQTGRLPNKNDKVRFLYWGADANGTRFLRLRRNTDDTEFELLSDCKIEIMKEKSLEDYEKETVDKAIEFLIQKEKEFINSSPTLKPFPFANILYRLSSQEKEIIDAYRNAKSNGLDVAYLHLRPHGVIVGEKCEVATVLNKKQRFPDIKNLKKPDEWTQEFFNDYVKTRKEGQITSHQLAKLLLEEPDCFIVTTAMGHSYDSFHDCGSHGKLKVFLSAGGREEMPFVIIGDTLRDNSEPRYPVFKQLFPGENA